MSLYKKILIAVDLISDSETIAEKAKLIALQNSAEINLIHVVEPVVFQSNYDLVPNISTEIEDTLIQRSQEFLKNLDEKMQLNAVTKKIEIGSPKAEIHQIAKQLNIDLIIMGTHGRHGFARLLGSTAGAMLHGTPCDILCVKIGDA